MAYVPVGLSYLSFQPLCFILCLICVGSVMNFMVLMTKCLSMRSLKLAQEEVHIWEGHE